MKNPCITCGIDNGVSDTMHICSSCFNNILPKMTRNEIYGLTLKIKNEQVKKFILKHFPGAPPRTNDDRKSEGTVEGKTVVVPQGRGK